MSSFYCSAKPLFPLHWRPFSCQHFNECAPPPHHHAWVVWQQQRWRRNVQRDTHFKVRKCCGAAIVSTPFFVYSWFMFCRRLVSLSDVTQHFLLNTKCDCWVHFVSSTRDKRSVKTGLCSMISLSWEPLDSAGWTWLEANIKVKTGDLWVKMQRHFLSPSSTQCIRHVDVSVSSILLIKKKTYTEKKEPL